MLGLAVLYVANVRKNPTPPERPSPEIEAMLAAEHAFAVQTRGFIDEVPKRSGPVVAEAVVAFERAMAGPGLIGAAFHQNFSMALRVCGKNELADEWQISALEVFSQHPRLNGAHPCWPTQWPIAASRPKGSSRLRLGRVARSLRASGYRRLPLDG